MTRMSARMKLVFTLLTCTILACPAAAYADPPEPDFSVCYERGCSDDELGALLSAANLYCASVAHPENHGICNEEFELDDLPDFSRGGTANGETWQWRGSSKCLLTEGMPWR